MTRRIEIESLIATGVAIDHIENDMMKLRVAADILQTGLPDDPARISEIVRGVHARAAEAKTLRDHAQAMRRAAMHEGHDEQDPDRLLAAAEQVRLLSLLSQEAGRLQRRLHDLHLSIGSHIRDLEDASMDAHILRLFDDGRPRSVREMERGIRAFLLGIADARGDWKLALSDRGSTLTVANGVPDGEVARALSRLDKTGHAAKVSGVFGSGRWVVVDVAARMKRIAA